MFNKTQLNQFWLIFQIGVKNFFASWLNILQGVILPLVILVVWLTFKSDDPFILISLVGGSILRNSLYSFHRTLIIERNNRWVEKLDNIPLRLSIKITAQTFVSLTITVIVSSMLLTLGFIGYKGQQEYIANINWWMVITGLFLLVILSNLSAYVLNEWSKSSEISQVISILFFNLCWNFLGCAYPYYIIASYEVLNTITYLFPHRYMFNVIQAGWVGADNMIYISDIDNYSTDFGLAGQLWIPYFATFGFIAFFISSIYIHRSVKGSAIVRAKNGAIYSKKVHSEYLYKIKKAKTMDELNKLFNEHKKANFEVIDKEIVDLTNEITEATRLIEIKNKK
ncbi:hypothetical protein STIUS_v1c00830 [Spiroplasma sp. TIUS-1]|uniref:hypothetical protein n=1 Tax=Spiroplasma sp. TIUS-1 TaxID=216963 RepID=UPI001397C1B2|nr:hypothetical protein [Spiroplasma sp. TIUS-1]QHX35638.1 hypothetical protein STIUS_v1c00830 [Spiroplasma sp. TIUS-1]